jgi:hypothetical protein
MDNQLANLLQPGRKLLIDYGKDHIGTRRIEIRAIVDDEWVVYRYFSRYWRYRVDHMVMFEMHHEDGRLKKR